LSIAEQPQARVCSPRLRLPNQGVIAALALGLGFATGCNLVLGNDRRSLSNDQTDPVVSSDGGSVIRRPPAIDAGADGGAGMRDNAATASDAGADAASCTSSSLAPFCIPGQSATESRACGLCGRAQQMRARMCLDGCSWTPFTPWSACTEPAGMCTPGETQRRQEPCGACGAGSRMSTRTCNEGCGWTEWSPGECAQDPDRCMPGTSLELLPVQCGSRCGTARQTRTCNQDCRWDAPVTQDCAGEGACAPGDTERTGSVGCNQAYCNKGIQPQLRTCSDRCQWGTPMNTGSCTIPSGVCRPEDQGGTGWRCRPNDPGFREFCYDSTESARDRCTWKGNREEYSGC
jgi:hypothetical protein